MKKIYNYISIGLSLSIIYNMIIFYMTHKINILYIDLITAIITSSLIGPILEEIIFRYLLINKLKQRYSANASILISSLTFSLFHIYPIKVIYAFILGLILGKIYTKENKIIYPILTHISGNLIVLFLTKYNPYILILSIILFALNISSIINKKTIK